MNILVTGGAWFIGRAIIKKLSTDNNIIILDNFLEQVHGATPNKNIPDCTVIEGDISDKKAWELAFSYNPDIILHLASETGTGQSMTEITRYANTNIIGTTLMLDLLNNTKHNVKKVILSSSRAVYGEQDNIESNKKLNPLSVYAVTKLTQEQLISSSLNIPYTIFRYQNVYGPGQSIKNPYTGIISIFSEKFRSNLDVDIWDNGKPTRDFVYIDDVVDATILSIDNSHTNNQIINVGTGEATSILEVTRILRDKINKNCKINITKYHRPGDILHAKADITKAKKLGWVPKVNIIQGLHRFNTWFKTQET